MRFKCNNFRCIYRLSYDEILLGTHELDECAYIRIECEGCGQRISKHEQIRHDAVECSNPSAKCRYCKQIFHLKQLAEHDRLCSARGTVKLEYQANEQAANADVPEPAVAQPFAASTNVSPAIDGIGANPLKRQNRDRAQPYTEQLVKRDDAEYLELLSSEDEDNLPKDIQG